MRQPSGTGLNSMLHERFSEHMAWIQIIRLEREIGIKRQTTLETVAEKLEPVKTVVVGVAGKVAQKAQALTEKISSRPCTYQPLDTPRI